MKYSFEDFKAGKIALDVYGSEWGKFSELCSRSGIKCICGKNPGEHERNPFGDWCVYNKDGMLYGSGNPSMPRVNFRDLTDCAPSMLSPNSALWQQFLDNKIGIKCDNREQYDRLMKELEKAEVKWCTGKPATVSLNVLEPTPTPPLAILPEWVSGGRVRAFYWRRLEDIDTDKAIIPFAAIFPAQPWSDFLAGKCYLRVRKEEWAEFAKRCEAAGKGWYWSRESHYGEVCKGTDCARINYEGKVVFGSHDGLVGFHNLPIIDFSSLLASEPTVAKKKPKQSIYEKGDRVKVIKRSVWFNVGDVLTLEEGSETDCPKARRNVDGMKGAIFSDRFEPLPEQPSPKEQPKEQPKYKVGDLFVLTEDYIYDYKTGDVVRLEDDDGTDCPFFRDVNGKKSLVSILYRRLKPYTVPAPKIIITHEGSVTTARLYEGDKVVKEGTAKCSPDDKFNFMEGATIAYNRMKYGQNFTGPSTRDLRQWSDALSEIALSIHSKLP